MDTWGDSAALGWRLLAPPANFVRAGYGDDQSQDTGYGRRLTQRGRLAARQVWARLRRR
jgi:hypothetical protein